MGSTLRALALVAGCGCGMAWAGPPPIEAFARIPNVQGARMSPDGRHVLYRTAIDDTQALAVLDRKSGKTRAILRNDNTERFALSWCDWANDTRILCGLFAPVMGDRGLYHVSRLLAINADGGGLKVLMSRSRAGSAQFQDRVLDWTSDVADSVLIQADEDGGGYPSIYELDVNNGRLKLIRRAYPPITSFFSDGQGNVRLGTGFRGANIYYYARRQDEDSWRQLARYEAFSNHDTAFLPVAVVPGTNRAYAIGDRDGRDALWEMDLGDEKAPELIASHPRVDIDDPTVTRDGRLRAIDYDADKPDVFYLDPNWKHLSDSLETVLPDTLNTIADFSRDESQYVVHAASDVDDAIYDIDTQAEPWRLARLGRAYPELDPASLSPMKPIRYAATDGTQIPGYLTLPAGVSPKNLPVIVMPHGGPIARDSWGFDFLVQFLASRGYAVVQMNFRGSAGFGQAWFKAAHQDWGGLTYADIRDGARWAAAQEFADPSRLCIVGWSFGGYAALLGAVRDPELFRCAASIAGVSDLVELDRDSWRFTNSRIAERQIGQDMDKLRADSPRRHAANVRAPILMVHGTYDVQVDVVQSRLMAKALKSAGRKDFTLVEIPNGEHSLWRPAERKQILGELERFLETNLSKAP